MSHGTEHADKPIMASFYVQKNIKVRTGWRLMEESYTANLRSQKAVPRIAWQALGFSDSMTIEQARARAHQLNQQNKIERDRLSALSRTASRVERDRLAHSAFVPVEVNATFMQWLMDNTSGSEAHRAKISFHWATAKKMVIGLQLTPEQYSANKKQIYRYIAMQTYSLDYAKKLINMINNYGRFTARITGKYYEQVPGPKGHDREAINDAYLDSDNYFGPSEPLTVETLALLKDRLKPEQYSWLKASLWLGLRPSELDAAIADRQQRVWRVEPGQPDALWVYQSKLTSKPRHLRWKPIPILYSEQKEAITILFEGIATKPLTKTLKRYSGVHLTLYGGRKAFTDLMLDKGHRLEDIAQWLGHSSIEMTWSKYKSRTQFHFKTVK